MISIDEHTPLNSAIRSKGIFNDELALYCQTKEKQVFFLTCKQAALLINFENLCF